MKRTSSILFAAAAFAAGTVALPALAETPEPTAAVATSTTDTTAESAKRYCIVEARTGSNIKRKTCQTRAAWLSEGFDPLAKK